MICVFAVAFVHFTHRHVFIAALVSRPLSCCNEGDNIINYQTMNNTNESNSHEQLILTTIRQDRSQEDQRLLVFVLKYLNFDINLIFNLKCIILLGIFNYYSKSI